MSTEWLIGMALKPWSLLFLILNYSQISFVGKRIIKKEKEKQMKKGGGEKTKKEKQNGEK